MRRTGLGRHGGIDDGAGDPLDGLVNLFDIGIVLALAFLIAGLGLTLDSHAHKLVPRASVTRSTRSVQSGPARGETTQPLPSPAHSPSVSGRGAAVGTVYRLANGQLVLVAKPHH
jgi:hypothetical protein